MTVQPSNSSAKNGIVVLAIVLLIYNLALWGIVRIVEAAGIIDWTLQWHESGIIVVIAMIIRMIDRAVFGKE